MGFAEKITEGGPIRTVIIVACLCILYIFLYIIYVLYRLLSSLMWWGKQDVIAKPFWFIFDRVTLFLFVLCLMFLPAVSIFFLILYFVFKVFGFFLGGTSPFSDCNKLGVFKLIDRMFEILLGKDAVGERIRNSFGALFEFLQKFMKEVFGVVFEGYELDDEYLNLALKSYLTDKMFPNDKESCQALKQNVLDLFKKKMPVIKLTYEDRVSQPTQKPMSEMDRIKYNNCVRQFTTDIPSDAGTIDKLKLMFSNEIAKKKCEYNVANGCPTSSKSVDPSCIIGQIERAMKGSTDDFGLSALVKIGDLSASTSNYFTKEQKGIDEKIKK
jgi:hypothetical protein